eukprot:CAMPEP_0179006212 /NCGR_PEP_ID=MMETSP0795-20121207/14411_1 /TAXON_ID=88552 /ORGANISM="Amoebophrya sp., Strain Ameob2" /LENGTH=202 /DNA_ID=CAMNT_0020700913 /DNA_START=89 /DNA_END=697 /DNA_ORIENTATION=-
MSGVGPTTWEIVCPNEGRDFGGVSFSNCEVCGVKEGSWGQENKIEVGDLIVEINGIVVKDVAELKQRRDMLSKPNLSVKIQRPEQRPKFLRGFLKEKTPGCRMKGRRVSWLADAGFAKELGVRVDDELVLINGGGYSEMTDDEKMQALTKIRPLEMVFRRPSVLENTNPRFPNAAKETIGFFGSCCASCNKSRPEEVVVADD